MTRLKFTGTRPVGLRVSEVSQASPDGSTLNGVVPERTADWFIDRTGRRVPRNQGSGCGPELFEVDSRTPLIDGRWSSRVRVPKYLITEREKRRVLGVEPSIKTVTSHFSVE